MGDTLSNWYQWDSIESFNVWHHNIKIELGLPKQSVAFDGTVINDGVITDQYTNPIIVASNDVRAVVESNYADGLILSTDPNRSDY